ncbi:hypothetical protein SCITRI_001949 (plasmid) [Spiroplasma citri]|nr:hypothetical protein SCITRI_001949 [Spiroplasma citri]
MTIIFKVIQLIYNKLRISVSILVLQKKDLKKSFFNCKIKIIKIILSSLIHCDTFLVLDRFVITLLFNHIV